MTVLNWKRHYIRTGAIAGAATLALTVAVPASSAETENTEGQPGNQ